jgi:hypothetical protein
MEVFVDDRVKDNKPELAVGKMAISGLLIAYDLAKHSFTFIGLHKVINQVAKHFRK